MKQRNTTQNTKIICHNEYNPLKQVIVAPPKYMEIKDVINTTQRHYLEENIDTDIALEQHQQFVHTLETEGVEVIQFEARKALNEQVFTRDIGFTIGEELFIASLKKDLRKPEELVLKEWLNEQRIPYQDIKVAPIEGGDVIIDNNKIWVGVSDRTSLRAIHFLKETLPAYEIIPVRLRQDILHLDCTFNIISEDTAIIFRQGIDKEVYKKIKKTYQNLIEVTVEEQFTMGPNVLSIGNKKLISLPENKRLNDVLRQHGFQVLEVEFSEIIKSGGSFRCCSLPLVRE
ncbi:dimethylarginine dimethylaminohydrolase family protein [Oceanobacillus halophilus]|uniref:Nitrate reductase n=1 Tax=Oceanobacillus halophilus TaxID=930130 RepID=A0A494ZWW8_9BACI|nr:arginine deiminase family protein [Oceanobacillus halophilus]RKQ30901.1 hypothetical protein D8M06_14840 [Oceanobacillus halophilus]